MFGFNGEFNTRFTRNTRNYQSDDTRERVFHRIKEERENRIRQRVIDSASHVLCCVIRKEQNISRIKQNVYTEFVDLWNHVPRHENLGRLILLFSYFYREERDQRIFDLLHAEIVRNHSQLISSQLDPPYLGGKVILLELNSYLRTFKEEHLHLSITLIRGYSREGQVGVFMYALDCGLFSILSAILKADLGSFIVPRVLQIIDNFMLMIDVTTFVYYFVKEMFSTVSRDLDRLMSKMPLANIFHELHPTCLELFRQTSLVNILINYNSLTRLVFEIGHCTHCDLLRYCQMFFEVVCKYHPFLENPVSEGLNVPIDSLSSVIHNFSTTLNQYNSLFSIENVTIISHLFYLVDTIDTSPKLTFDIFLDHHFIATISELAIPQLLDLVKNVYLLPICPGDPAKYVDYVHFSYIYTSAAVMTRLFDSTLLDCEIPNELTVKILEWARTAFKFYLLSGFHFVGDQRLQTINTRFHHDLSVIIRRIYLWCQRMSFSFEWRFNDIVLSHNLKDLIANRDESFSVNFCGIFFPVSYLVKSLQVVPTLFSLSSRSTLIAMSIPHFAGSISVHRHKLYDEAFSMFLENPALFVKSIPTISFVNIAGTTEPGVDGGGLFREFMTSIIEYSFGPDSSFFIECDAADRSLYPNTMSNFSVLPLHYYFIGLMVGRAIALDICIPAVNLNVAFWQQMVDPSELDINWLPFVDRTLYTSLTSLRGIPDIEGLGLYFSIDVPTADGFARRDLIQDGDTVLVTRHNLEEYINLYAKFKLTKSVQSQIASFRRGISIAFNHLNLFDAREMQRLFGGDSAVFDFDDFRRNVVYEGYCENSIIIKRFWKVFSRFTSQEAFNLLKFATSYSAPPRGGFKNLSPKFCITFHSYSHDMHLPTASTCSNNFCLPPYSSSDIMAERLKYIVSNSIGFELN